MPPLDIAGWLLGALDERGIKSLHHECRLLKEMRGYMNFGLLAALDHLQVTHHVMNTYPIDKRRMFCIGTSYGGYIALLIAKLAPNTFKLTIDNSGFSGPQDDMASVYGLNLATIRGGIKVYVQAPIAFIPAPGNRFSFSEDRRIVREIGVDAHYELEGCGAVHSYHSKLDAVAPFESKINALETVSKHRKCDMTVVGTRDLDGKIFKNLDHGMNASIRGLFDLSYNKFVNEGPHLPADNRF
jgi:pimeloyl-ACP methyl ester carboxylesterase